MKYSIILLGLIGIVYDPLHIEEEFDKFMGNGYYRTFCEYLDRLFILSLSNQKLPGYEVKVVMNILPDFINKKINYYRSNSLMDLETANQIVNNFNRIWNSMQVEYDAYFSQEILIILQDVLVEKQIIKR